MGLNTSTATSERDGPLPVTPTLQILALSSVKWVNISHQMLLGGAVNICDGSHGGFWHIQAPSNPTGSGDSEKELEQKLSSCPAGLTG